MFLNHFRGIALTLVAAFLLASCADNEAVRARYDIEKALFKAEKSFRKFGIKPELTDDASFLQLRDSYDSVLQQSFRALAVISLANNPIERREIGELAYTSATRLTQLLFSDGKIDSCVTVLNQLLSRNVILDQSRMRVYHNLGRALQANGDLDSALVVLDKVVDEFSPPRITDGTLFGPIFDLPSQIHSLFLTLRDSAEASRRFDRAENYYRQFTNLASDTVLSNGSHINLARLYSSVGRWNDEIAELRQLRNSADANNIMPMVRIADVYSSRLNNYKRAIVIYDSLRAELKGSDTLYEPPLVLKRSIAEIGLGQFAKARSSLVELEKNYPGYYFNTAMAQYSKAQTFDLSGNWDRAELEYKYLFEQYTGSIEAMSTYLYLAKKYTERSRPELAKKWYDRAIQYYDEIARRGTSKQAIVRAMLFKAEAYKRTKDFSSTASTLVDLYDRFPETQSGQLGMLEAARIYKNKLGQPQTADSLIERLKTALAEVDEEQDL